MNKKLTKSHYSTAETADLLGVSRVAILKKINNGRIPAQKVGRNYIISKEDLEAVLGHTVSAKQKEEIKQIVKKAVKQYQVTFRKLGEE